jgi:lysophospholipase L1-like esterase
MQRHVLRIAVCLLALAVPSTGIAEKASKPRLILIGDSTVKNGRGDGGGGLWGWGQVLDKQFDTSRIDIENHARGGRSSRTYLTEGLWEETLKRVRPGDFVIMQFGHNDGGDKFEGNRPRASIKGNGDETERGVVAMTGQAEVVHSYGWYLRKYIADTKAKGAKAIVCSLVPRDRWQDGKVIRSNQDYGKWAGEAAHQADALFIDLNDIVARRYEEIGEETVGRDYFTEVDWTHTTKVGAEVTAACVAKAIRQLDDCPLKNHLLPEKVSARERDHWKFVFFDSDTPGYIQLRPDDKYQAQRGYGFEPGSTISSTALGSTSDKPFYFSVAVPEGNYRVLVRLSTDKMHTPATVKAELRRLMLLNKSVLLDPGATEQFTVNVRRPSLPDGESVRLKPREKQNEMWAWDEKLTLEINGRDVYLSSVEIAPEPTAITVFLAGDSTVTDQPLEPWSSWGQMLPAFFLPGVAVANHAQSGESIRSSLGAKRFDKIFSLIKPGDYLFLQFGHNDMKDKSPDALGNYRNNLKKLVAQTREFGAYPALVTSMERKAGLQAPTLEEYPQTVRDLAREFDVPLIDLNAASIALYKALGKNLDLAFQDGTHHTKYGSYLFAQCVAQSIRDLKLPLAESLVDGLAPFDPSNPDPFDSVNIPASPKSDPTQPAGS